MVCQGFRQPFACIRPPQAASSSVYEGAFPDVQIEPLERVSGLAMFIVALMPGGGGYPLVDRTDVKPAKFGQVDNVITSANNSGGKQEQWQGIDINLNGRSFGGQHSAPRRARTCSTYGSRRSSAQITGRAHLTVSGQGRVPCPAASVAQSRSHRKIRRNRDIIQDYMKISGPVVT